MKIVTVNYEDGRVRRPSSTWASLASHAISMRRAPNSEKLHRYCRGARPNTITEDAGYVIIILYTREVVSSPWSDQRHVGEPPEINFIAKKINSLPFEVYK
jgi:hypothetical protein